MSSYNNSKEIMDLLEALCRSFSSQNHKTILRDASNFISNIIQSSHTMELPFDEMTIVAKVSNLLSTTSKSQGDLNLFMSLHENISSMITNPRDRNSIITFLFLMANSGNNVANNIFRIESKMSSALNFMGASRSSPRTPPRNHCTTTDVDRLYRSRAFSITQSQSDTNIRSILPHVSHSTTAHSQLGSPSEYCGAGGDSNDDLVQDLIYSFTGVQGKYLKKDIVAGGFKLDVKARNLGCIQAGMLLRLAELGFHHDQIQSFTDPKSGKRPLGLLGQGFVSAMKKELTRYYGMVAMLQEQLNRQKDAAAVGECRQHERLTLLKLILWTAEPMHRMQWLTMIGEASQDKKGGVLATAVYQFLDNGDPTVQSLAKDLLLAVCVPLQFMLSRWLLDGEIEDPHSEFFIEMIPEINADRLWHDKYRVREAMLPCFISKELAYKILVTGKSINFLRVICEDQSKIKGREELKQCLDSNVESIFAVVSDTKLHMMLDQVYLNTSKKLLSIVLGPHCLQDHLHAMRHYLLLGQGDFIGILMELLKSELDRPAKDLYCYDLSSKIDSALRLTHPQLEDPEILNHLDVFLMTPCEGEVGWDIFSLRYTVRGPLAMLLEASMPKYDTLFKLLWKTKHIEYVLSAKIWKDQIGNAKILRSMHRDIVEITYRLHSCTSEMIHFINQMQYYILFEVIECSWSALLTRVNEAKALDDILEAHNEFLETIKAGIFLDEKSTVLKVELTTVYNSIMKLEIWQERFFAVCFEEFELRKAFENDIAMSEKKGTYGVTAEKRLIRDEELKVFEQTIYECHKSLGDINTEYECAVRAFLLTLASHEDHNLQLFGTRLDFNEYYKRRDQRIGDRLMFQNLRMSNMSCSGIGLGGRASKFNSNVRHNQLN